MGPLGEGTGSRTDPRHDVSVSRSEDVTFDSPQTHGNG